MDPDEDALDPLPFDDEPLLVDDVESLLDESVLVSLDDSFDEDSLDDDSVDDDSVEVELDRFEPPRLSVL